MIILYIGGQGNGEKTRLLDQFAKSLTTKPTKVREGTLATPTFVILRALGSRCLCLANLPRARWLQEAFAPRFWSMLDAISSTLHCSGTDPFGVNLSTNPGSNCAIAAPAISGEIPALAASVFT